MWRLDKPVPSSRQTFQTCIRRISNADLKTRLQEIEEDVARASDAFEAAAGTALLHTLVRADNIGGKVTRQEMSDVYTLRFAKKGSPGRAIYDELLAAPAHGRCPLCGQRTVSTLDHHLPKAHYPALVVAPVNLVPACADCNKAKIDRIPRSSAEETLHPYFDDIEGDPWLNAEVIETTPAALRFFVDPPGHWDATITARVLGHFKTLNLSFLYASQAAEELLNIRHHLAILLAEAGPAEVKAHILQRADSCENARVNSWQTATYRALSASDWYCAGGFA